MKKNRIKPFFLLLVLGSSLQNVYGLDVVPEVVEFRGKPGARMSKTITVRNNSEESMDISLELPENLPGNQGWLKISKQKFTLEPNRIQKLKLKARVPRAEGELTQRLALRGKFLKDKWYEIRSNHQIYMKVQGTEIPKLEIVQVQAVQKGPVLSLEVSVKNTGNVHLQPKLVAEIDTRDGPKMRKVFESPVKAILPNEEAFYATSVPTGKNCENFGLVSVFFKDGQSLRKTARKFEIETSQFSPPR